MEVGRPNLQGPRAEPNYDEVLIVWDCDHFLHRPFTTVECVPDFSVVGRKSRLTHLDSLLNVYL